MAFLQIHSTNQNLSYILVKNPTTGMLIKRIRQGFSFGYFNKDSNQIYNLYFRDGVDEISYQDDREQEFEYFNIARYSSPRPILNLIDLFLNSTFKTKHELDIDGFEHTIHIASIQCKHDKYVENLNNTIEGYTITCERINPYIISLKITTQKSIYELLNLTMALMFLMMFETTKELVWNLAEEDYGTKMASIFKAINAPYYWIYDLKRRIFSNNLAMKNLKNLFEYCESRNINIETGNTIQQRYKFIKLALQNTKFDNIIDIGCGEGHYIQLLKEQNFIDKKYFGLDTDENILKNAEQKASRINVLDRTTFYTSSEDILKQLNSTSEKNVILLSEVIEHIEFSEVFSFLDTIFAIPNIVKIILTTPNADFNQNFSLKEFRHPDHKYELTKIEFNLMMKNIQQKYPNININIHEMGDSVNGIHVSHAAELEWNN